MQTRPVGKVLQRIAVTGVLVGLLAGFGVAGGASASAATTALTVCPRGCDFSSLQAAVEAASPGATISIGAGEYPESLFIGKSLKLIGAGQERVNILGGITVAGVGIEVTLEGFTISRGTGIVALGTPLLSLRRLTVSEHLGDGIDLSDAARALLVHTTVAGNGMSGLVAKNGAQAELYDVTLAENALDGLAGYDQADLRISLAEAVGNGANGILIAGQARAQVELVRSSANGGRREELLPFGFRRFCGLTVADSAEAEIRAVRLDHNREAGLCVGGPSSILVDPPVSTKVTLTNSRISENEGHGIIVGDLIKTQDETWATIANNFIVKNGLCGIQKDFERVHLTLGDNRLADNAEGEICG